MKELLLRTRQLVRLLSVRRWILLLTAIGLPTATLVALETASPQLSNSVDRDRVPPAELRSPQVSDSQGAKKRLVPADTVGGASPTASASLTADVPDIDAPVSPRERDLDSRAQNLGRSTRVGTPIGGSIWVSQGAGPALFGQNENVFPNNEVIGAVHTLAADPTDADILYAGGVNGGVWKTTNATAVAPSWISLTDQENGLSIGALEFDPLDGTHQTLVAGIGRFSSFGRSGPFRTGILRTADGGTTWAAFDGGGALLDKNISGVAARGSTIVVSVNFAVPNDFPNIGIFRSVDSGATFTQISTGDGSITGLPGGLSYDLEGDPTSTSTLYTNMNFADNAGGVNGIYKSTDTGANWTKVSNAVMDALIVTGSTSNIEMSVGTAGQVYVAILNFGQLRNGGVFRSGDGGATWVTMDVPLTNENGTPVGTNPSFKPDAGEPGSQGSIHFSIQADPSNANIVYVGGDRQPSPLPNSIGAHDFSGRLFRGDASQPPGSQWVHLTHSNVQGAFGGGTASNSAPHADSREMVFDANGNIIECDDGGIYRRTNPQSNTGDWFSVIGSLRVTEFHDIAYDSNSNVIMGGTQDNGTLLQLSPGSTTWQNIRGGDGGDVAVDDTSLPGFSIRYLSSQFLGGFSRFTYDAANNLVDVAFPSLTLIGGGNPLDGQFSTPIALSAENQTHLVIGGDASVYESLDQGETIREIGANIVVNSTTSGNAMAYGGRLAGVPNPDVLYVGDFDTVFRRTKPGFLLQATSILPITGVVVRDIVIDPANWNRVYVITDFQVFMSNDAGANWTDITGDLTNVQILRSGEFVTSTGEDGLVVGTNTGAFLSLRTALGTWNEIGTNLPNVPVWDLDYDAADDVLVAGTLGRGAWTIPNASATILPDCTSTTCLGACCSGTTCADAITEVDCTNIGGAWFVGDTCDSVCLGTCCDGPTCLNGETAGSCATIGGAFQLGASCTTVSCNGACCEALVCTDAVAETACAGTWLEGQNCADTCFGACCTGNTCTDAITELACVNIGGIFSLGENCGSVFCPCINGVGDCVSGHAGVGCATESCCNAVCSQDSTCCTVNWTSTCADRARASCAENDNCADAFALPEGITTFDNSLATTDGPADCLSGDTNVGKKDIWFTHDSTCTGDMTVSLCVNTNFDNTLQIYESAVCNPLGTQLGCGDDTCGQGGGPATLTVPVVQGVQYLIRPGGWAGSFGSGEINLSIAPADLGDSDGDGVVNSCDICPGGDDNIDCQPNGVPDACEAITDCNNNGVPDECEPDSDGDGVPDDCDICLGGDDTIDSDGDGVPDACDICPFGDDNIDTDGDGVPDACDLCPGGDDNIDCQPDGIPDACQVFDDCNGNGIPDECDPDLNGNGIPDDCELEPPVLAAPPHNILKNRYISINRGNAGLTDFDIRLTLTSTLVNGVPVSRIGQQFWANAPDADCISIAGPTRPVPAPDWSACPTTVHLTGCPIIPTSTYDIIIVVGATISDPPLSAQTQAKPGATWFGDCVGFFNGTEWSGPNGVVNADDFAAAIKTFQNPGATPGCGVPPCNATHTSVTDVEPNRPDLLPPGNQINKVVNIADVLSIIIGFQGLEYPGPQIDLCPDP